ncbi:glycosyl transferase family group 2-domain-containing protein [Protomyces lactucae-debilis]|uniref:Glycosyl transferase family group 2-domain-containing protein n=1 Tax=Protomyces lactucae-debilis TaxID=2754530 RepID=A0A1Y2FEQ6_PROLT|nr:glycosyl transferase family group 2-domain-containing protein [Protomyces lactucae-debilis]ORY82428.1 glycosyl transferase family group 2-domain-containing protein [Protomyces lactucae-debilis]
MGLFKKSTTTVVHARPIEETAADGVLELVNVDDKVRDAMMNLFSPSWSQRSDEMLEFIYEACSDHDWFELWEGTTPLIAVRVNLEHAVFPLHANNKYALTRTLERLNTNICFIMSTESVADFVRQLHPSAFVANLSTEINIQVRRDLTDFQHAKVHQSAAILRQTGQILFWGDDLEDLMKFATLVEDLIAQFLWRRKQTTAHDLPHGNHDEAVSLAIQEELDRPVQMLLPVMVFLTIMVNFIIIALAMRAIVFASIRTNNYLRFIFVLYFPFLFFLTSFFSLMLVVIVINCVGPVQQLYQNSKFYSCYPPKRMLRVLPHITVQCPVYKEDLGQVIVPTVQSIKLAIATYERQGGSASIFINDDGLQLLNPAQREMRKMYYAMNDIGWVARPGHGKNGFIRAGRFKKASNMNFAMDISQKLHEKLCDVERSSDWTEHDEADAYQACLNNVLAHEFSRTGHEPWAAGNISMGELILLVDSDTRVPLDCFLDAANEFHLSPNVAIIQHNSGVMQVVHDFFENAITYFTQSIYFSLQYATSAGDTAAFVGHNAFLRWSALQEVAWFDDTDGKTKYWSESHVSEDFEMSLKLQTQGYISRYATYSNEAFQEGVSLTCYDEMLRWSKYAYGCSELVFNPFSQWHRKGPFTDIFIHFLRSDLNSFSKFTMIGYIGTYYAIALRPLLVVNYLVMGWYRYFVEQGFAFYNEGFGVFLSVIFVFNLIGPVSAAIIKYRAAKNETFWRGLYDNFKWSLPLMIFLGGLSMHLSYALIAHLCDLVRLFCSLNVANSRTFNGVRPPRQSRKATSSQNFPRFGQRTSGYGPRALSWHLCRFTLLSLLLP